MKDSERIQPAPEENLQVATTKTWSDTPPSSSGAPQPAKREPNPTLTAALNSIKPADFLSVHQTPCARIGFLTGIGGGVAVGALRFVVGAVPHVAANWAVGAGIVMSLAQYEYCQAQRRAERAKMKRVVEVYDKKHADERAAMEEKRRLERMATMEEEAKKKATSYWRFW